MKKLIGMVMICLPLALAAQTRPAGAAGGTPKLVTRLGGLTGGNVSVADANRLVDSMLRVTDDKKRTYQVVGYHLFYRQITRYSDPETNQAKTAYDVTYFKHSLNPLPETWRNLLKEKIKPGETLAFENLIVRARDGSKYAAPKITFMIVQ